jgi:hypothetical protein
MTGLTLALLLTLATLGHSTDDDCGSGEEIRLDKPGKWGVELPGVPPEQWRGSMQDIPVMDQGDVGICYSYSGSEMIDAYRFSHKPPRGDMNLSHRTSPTESAVEYKYGANPDGGQICGLVDSVKMHKSCDAKDIEGEFLLNDKTGEQAHKEMAQLAASMSLDDTSDPNGFYYREGASGFCPVNSDIGFDNVLDLNRGTRDIVSKLQNAFSLATENCRRIPLSSSLTCNFKRPLSNAPERLRSNLNVAMDQPSPVQPVGMIICADVIEKGSHAPDKNVSCGYHAVVVIGRRKNPTTGKCDFLVRNSWGTSCNGVSPEWQCDGGNIWMDSTALTTHADSTETLE